MNDVKLLVCEVMHSMKLNLPNLIPWIILDRCDKMVSCHCTCMAGLGEACSHVAALTFFLNYDYRFKVEKSVTDEFAYWRAQRQEVTPQKLSTVKFDVPSKLVGSKKKSDVPSKPVLRKKKSTSLGACPIPYKKVDCHENLVTFLHELKVVLPKSVALDVVSPFCDESETDLFHSADDSIPQFEVYVDGVRPLSPIVDVDNSGPPLSPTVDVDAESDVHSFSPIADSNFSTFELKFPRVLNTLYKPELEQLSVEELIQTGKDMAFNLKTSEIEEIERLTRAQSASEEWFTCRIGRITAYNMKNVCHARNLISLTTLKSVCYPPREDLSYVDSIWWGKTHEKDAEKEYIRRQEVNHSGFKFDKCGLFIHQEYPFIAASPDGIVHCGCCGKGVAEFKCPSTLQNGGDVMSSSLPYIDVNGLKENREYYYQIMTQLMITEASYADFCVWTPTSLYIQRVLPDRAFFEKIKTICAPVFTNVIVPELLGRKFTRNPELLKTAKGPNKNPASKLRKSTAKKKKRLCYLCGDCDDDEENISLFSFPQTNVCRLECWEAFCHIPPAASVHNLQLCEKHFVEEDVNFSSVTGNKTLKRGSVPEVLPN